MFTLEIALFNYKSLVLKIINGLKCQNQIIVEEIILGDFLLIIKDYIQITTQFDNK